MGVVKRLWSMDILMEAEFRGSEEIPKEYFKAWQMKVRKRQLTNLFRHGEQCPWLGSGRVTPSKPKQPARFPQVSFRCTFSEYSAQDFDEDSQDLKGRD